MSGLVPTTLEELVRVPPGRRIVQDDQGVVERSYHVWVRGGGRTAVVRVDPEGRRLEVWSYDVPPAEVASGVQGNGKDGFWCWVGFDDVTEVGYLEKSP